MKITKRQLRRIIREEAGSTSKYDDDSALKGDQSELPDGLQSAIIDKTVEDREEAEDKKKNEVRRMIRSIMLERGTGNPALKDAERNLMRATIEFIDQYRLSMGFDPNDFGDDKRVRRTIDDIIGGILGDM